MKMTTTVLRSLSMFALSLAATQALGAMDPVPTPTPAPSPAPAAPVYNDGQIVQIITTVNTVEINEAEVAMSRAKAQIVKDFATKMVADHNKANSELTGIESKLGISAEESDTSVMIEKEAADQLASLKTAADAAFDKLYLNDQVTDHQMVLNELDQNLIPQAKTPELVSFLKNLRAMVQMHLDEAQKLVATP